ncbi:MAG: isoleucine--tRNA ligase [Bacteroidota bacterium]
MKKYPFYPSLNLVQIAQEILTDWQKYATFLQSIAQKKNNQPFVFYEGPPSANGSPGIHHVLARTLKDLFCRYKTMQGYKVDRKSGWDTHGLPVELQVEKELGITKEDIGKKISIEDYNLHCEKAVMRYQEQWEALTEKMGYWIDLKNPYKTCSKEYILALWSVLKRLYEKKFLYKGYSIQPYSPAAGTGLSTHELNQPGCYKMVKDISIVAQFQLKNKPDTYLLAWTTTPWTLPANSALAINQKATYVRVKTYNRYTGLPIYVILAEKCLPTYFEPSMQNALMQAPTKTDAHLPWQVVDQYQGTEMLGWEYYQLLPYVQPSRPAFYIVHADFATLDGTGIIHISPTFGKDDYLLAQQKAIPSITIQNQQGEELPIVDRQGRFVAQITDFAGCYVKEAYVPDTLRNQPGYLPTDVQIIKKLKKENKAFHTARYTHSYPHCWRTDKPIIYYPLAAWFLKTTACKDRLTALNKTIKWHPASTGKGRFGEWLENVLDWNLSRSRFWGTPLPIWRTKDNSEEKCIGSLEELSQEVDRAVAAGVMEKPFDYTIDLHRPYVDGIVLVSEKGKKMYREPDLVDVWFDAGAMPYAQGHSSQQLTNEIPTHFPADFIAEGIDQTRGWFFTLHVLAVMLFDHVAFKNVLATGLLLDKNGNKMSKRLGNAIDPFELLATYGPDVIRWYMMVNAHPWDNLKFDVEGLKEVRNKFFGTLYNTYQFFALYANLDEFIPTGHEPEKEDFQEIDLWICSKLALLVETVTLQYNAYNPTKAARAIQNFVIDDLSNWYVRLNRKRFWQASMSADKRIAYQVLYTCLRTVTQLSSPVAPFYMDKMYQDLHPEQSYTSVHLSPFPKAQQKYRDKILEEKMAYAQNITSLVHSLRKKHNIKVRQPLHTIRIVIQNQDKKTYIQAFQELIMHEVNIKKIDFVADETSITTLHIKPNLKELGKAYGSLLPKIQHAIAQLNQQDIQQFKSQKNYSLKLQDQLIKLPLDQVIITTQNLPGWATATHENITLALDLHITPALQAEGWARELVSHIQNTRKEKGLAVEQKIYLALSADSNDLQSALMPHQNYIMQETQALEIVWHTQLQHTQTIKLGSSTLSYSLSTSPKKEAVV